jgi:hypothetical protein
LDVDGLDAALHDVLVDEEVTQMIAVTEVTRAATDAAVDRYTITDGVTHYEWLAAPGACARCLGNAAVGPLLIGQSFPNGAGPPLHPRCLCALVPSA